MYKTNRSFRRVEEVVADLPRAANGRVELALQRRPPLPFPQVQPADMDPKEGETLQCSERPTLNSCGHGIKDEGDT